MPLVRWQFANPRTGTSASFLVNPKEGGSPDYEKNLTYHYPTAYRDSGYVPRVIVYEGRPKPRSIEFSGTLIDQAQYTMFADWYYTRSPVAITDDHGRVFTVVIKSFLPKRERTTRYRWKHSYTVMATVLASSAL